MTLADPPQSVESLLTFGKPPVTEVVLGVQLPEPVIDLEVLADFTARVKGAFPGRTQHPPLPPLSQDFSPRPPAISVELAGTFAMPRTWFISDDDARVIQVQEDRFIVNWRRADPESAEYPRYENLREEFRKRLAQLIESIEAAGKKVPAPNFCEVTYVNQLSAEPSSGIGHGDLGVILKPVAQASYEFLPPPEDAQYAGRFRIVKHGEPRGRFMVTCAPNVRSDGRAFYLLNLTSQLAPESAETAAMWEALDLGREWIVKGFLDLTTEEMHEKWELKEE